MMRRMSLEDEKNESKERKEWEYRMREREDWEFRMKRKSTEWKEWEIKMRRLIVQDENNEKNKSTGW